MNYPNVWAYKFWIIIGSIWLCNKQAIGGFLLGAKPEQLREGSFR